MKSDSYLCKQIIYNNVFTSEECENIICRAGFKNSLKTITNDASYGKANSYWIETDKNSEWIQERIMKYVKLANDSFFNFSITSLKELQLLEYTGGCYFDWHIDIAGKESGHSRRKINTLTFLSSPEQYEGGILTFDLNRNTPQSHQLQGSMLLFPSYQVHKVTPVTNGIRYALSGIIHGPFFR